MPRRNGVDSFDSVLLGIRAKGRWLGYQNTGRLSVLVVVNDTNNKKYTHLAIGCSAADQVILRDVFSRCVTYRRADIRMTYGR